MTDPNFHISTPRLYLSYFQPKEDSHCDFLVTLYNTPEFVQSMGGMPITITTRNIARSRLETRFPAEHTRNGYGTYLISLKPTSFGGLPDDAPFKEKLPLCKLIGTVSLLRVDGPESYKVPDLGFAILPSEMKKGYAKEASQGLLKYAKEELGVDAVLGMCNPENEASKGVFRSLGFEDRGEMALKAFGGVWGAVWALPGMSEDLAVYGV